MYIPLAGFATKLTKSVSPMTNYLPIPQASYQILLDNLADGDYSYLMVREGRAIEIVKITNTCGKIVLVRGAEKTHAKSFRCGVGVAFVLTAQGVKDTVCQMQEC